MLTATPGEVSWSLGELAMLAFEVTEGFIAPMARIYIDDDPAGWRAGGSADIGARLSGPPALNGRLVRCRLEDALEGSGMLGRTLACVGVPASTGAIRSKAVDGKDRPATAGIAEGSLVWRGIDRSIRRV